MWRSERVITDPAFAHLPRTMDALLAKIGVPRELQQRFITVDGTECWLKFAYKSHPFRLKTLALVTGPWCPAERLVEFRNLQRLREIGLDAPRPIVYAEERWCGVMQTHLLAIERVRDVVDLEKLLAERSVPEEKLTELLFTVGDVVGRMHAAGFLHRDLFPRNLLIAGEPGRDARIWIIDCRKGSWWKVAVYPKTYDLGCFELWAATHAPLAARTAFFAAYVRAARASSVEEILNGAERVRRSLHVRYARKRAVHRQAVPLLEAPRVEADAVRRFEPAGPRTEVSARRSPRGTDLR